MKNPNIQLKRTTPLVRIVGSLFTKEGNARRRKRVCPMKRLSASLCILLMSLTAVTARAQTCATSAAVDPQGDAFFAPGLAAPAFLDILAGSFTVCDTLTFTVDVAGSLNALPNPPGSGGVYFWTFGLNSDPSTNPPGFPSPPGQTGSPEFLVYALWDGTAFSGVFLDRRPALTGGSPVQYSIPVSVSGSRIILTVPAALAALVQPLPGASWYCITGWDNTTLIGIASNAFHFADILGGQQPWPQ